MCPAMRAKCLEGNNVMALQHGTIQFVIPSKIVSGLSGCLVQHDTQMKPHRKTVINTRLHRVMDMFREETRESEESGV
jgi:hypothetical protein